MGRQQDLPWSAGMLLTVLMISYRYPIGPTVNYQEPVIPVIYRYLNIPKIVGMNTSIVLPHR